MPHAHLSFSIFIFISSFALALGLTSLVKRILLEHTVLDVPNNRSSHKIPLPRGGGLALLAIIIPTLIGAAFVIDDNMRHAWLIAAVFLLAIVSWLDDCGHVSIRVRLGTHIIAAFLGSLSFTPQEMLWGGAIPFWLDRASMILGWVWFVNLYNFMDGIDGITGTETITITTGVYLVMLLTGVNDQFAESTTLILAGVCLGFLFHNWHPAKIFLGDVGSIPLGYLSGFCLLSLAVTRQGGGGNLASAIILPLYYLADSGITIAKRALHHEKIWQAHREHFYQRAALAAGRHDQVVIWVAIANLGLIVASLGSIFFPWEGLGLGVLIVAALLRKLQKYAFIK
ncbi:MAG: glycosyltransferase family 4 protein [Alphaproteobacteria bacterium]|nr:glycosyltransferase family 4 protein [Alphaproteobacteria bacterium]